MGKNSKNHKWVKIEKSGSLIISFKFQKKAYKFAPVPRGRIENPQDLAIANRVASEIEQAVKLGTFTGLEPWLPKTLVEKVETYKPTTPREVWLQYKVAKTDKVSKAASCGLTPVRNRNSTKLA